MGFVGDLRLSNAKRKLQNQLSEIVSLAEGHKAADLPAGHKYYKILETRAQKAIVDYQTAQTKFGVPVTDYDEIAAGVPTLKMIEEYAGGEPQPSAVPKIAFGTMIGGAFITLLFAGYHNLYLWATHFANMKWGH